MIDSLEPRVLLAGTLYPLSAVPALNSLPTAFAQLYLDFDGAPASSWYTYSVPVTPAYTQDADATTFSESELTSIRQIFARVAEKYSPFNVNVTTVDPGNRNDHETLAVVIGGNGAWTGVNTTGISYVGSFGGVRPNTSYVFSTKVGNDPRKTAELIAHESGHGFYLGHQSVYNGTTKVAEYNPGDSMRAPIMGNSLSSARGVWWYGTGPLSAMIMQDDLATLSGDNDAFGFRSDDHANQPLGATPLAESGQYISAAGVIEQMTDADYFLLTTPSGELTITLEVAEYGPMLDATLELRDASDVLVASADTISLGEALTATVPAGTYYVVVRSHGEYGDLGQYSIAGTLPTGTVLPLDAKAAGPYTVAEGRTITLSAASSTGTGLAFEWDLDGDGLFGETGAAALRGNETGANPVFSAARLDGPTSATVTVRVTDITGASDTAAAVVNIVNATPAPTISGLPSDIFEGDTISLVGAANDSGALDTFTWSWVVYRSGEVYATGDRSTFDFMPDDNADYEIELTVMDDEGATGIVGAAVQVLNVAPVVEGGPDIDVVVNSAFYSVGMFVDPGNETIEPAGWVITVDYDGPGPLPPEPPAAFDPATRNFALDHVYSTPGDYTIVITVDDQEDGSSPQVAGEGSTSVDTVLVHVAPSAFEVLAVASTSSGFDVKFSQAADLSMVNVHTGYSHALGSADLSVTGQANGAVPGSLIWDASRNTARFIATGGSLATDVYTIMLRSAPDGWRDIQGVLLDGDGDGKPGGDFIQTVQVVAPVAPVLRLPDFARGPGQPVNVDASGTALEEGLPVLISNGAGLSRLELDLLYDASLLTITGTTLADGMPAGWTVSTASPSSGVLHISLLGGTPLPAGPRALIRLAAAVPAAAPRGAVHVLGLANVVANSGALAVASDDAVHKVAYLGDATGDGSIGALDAHLISRVVSARDGGFDYAPMADPALLVDATGDGTVSGLDAAFAARKSVGLDQPQIPGIPESPQVVMATIDPTVRVSSGISGSRGQTCNVGVAVTDDAAGLLAADLTFTYNTALLDLANAGVTLSPYLSSQGWGIASNVNDATGTVRVSIYSLGAALPAGTPDLLNLAFSVPAGAPAGVSPVTVAGRLNEGRLVMTAINGSVTIPIDAEITGVPATTPEGTAVTMGRSLFGQQGAVSYAWSVTKDGTAFALPVGTVTNGSTFTFTPTDNGSYAVTLRVTDASANTGTSTQVLAVTNALPSATFSGANANEGAAATVSFTSPADPSAVDVAAGFHYSYALTAGALAATYAAATDGISKSFTFADNGVYTVYGRVFDKDGGSRDYTASVNVANVAPGATLTNSGPVNEGDAASIFFTNASDPSTSDTAAGFRYSFATSTAGLAASYAAAGANSTTFTFDDNGTQTIFGRIFDKDGGSRDYTTVVTINNVDPTATFSASSPINEGASATLAFASPADASTADAVAGFHYSFALSAAGLASSYATATDGTTRSFAFTDNGTNTVYGRIFDKDGGFRDYTATVTVNNVIPNAGFSNAGPVAEGNPVTVRFTNPTDVSSADVAAGFHYSYALTAAQLASSYASALDGISKSFTFEDNGSYTVYGRLFDKDGGARNFSTSVTVTNSAPTSTFSNSGPITEGAAANVFFGVTTDASTADTSAGFHYSYALTPTALASSYAAATDGTSRGFTFVENGLYTVYGRVFDKDGGSRDYTTTVTVNNVAPTVSLSGLPAGNVVQENQSVAAAAAVVDPGVEDIFTYAWSVRKDGAAYALPAGTITNAASFSFTPAAAGSYAITVVVTDDDGGAGSAETPLAVHSSTFGVVEFTPTPSGFDLRLSRAADLTLLNLYPITDVAQSTDLSVVGRSVGAVAGSLAYEASTNTVRFVRSGGTLPPDTYTVTLSSRADGWTDTLGTLLDGNSDGLPGGDYVTTFTVASSSARVLSIPDLVRGPGQRADTFATPARLPIQISNAASVTSLRFELEYDPSLLNITSVALASAMPANWTLTTSSLGAGHLQVTASGATALTFGAREIARLSADVPANAAYGRAQALRITAPVLNNGALPATGDSAIHKVAFVGDVTGNRDYSGADAAIIARLAVGLDSGLEMYPLADPILLADVTGDGSISSLDASDVARKSVGIAVTSIPDLPVGNVPLAAMGQIDPVLSLAELTGEPGSSVVMPVRIDRADSLMSADFTFRYDTGLLDLADGDVGVGELSAGWQLIQNVSDATGTIKATIYTIEPLPGGDGTLLNLAFSIPGAAAEGISKIPIVIVPSTATRLNEGRLPITPVDGSITVDALSHTVFATPADDRFLIQAGAEGLQVLSGAGGAVYAADPSSLSKLILEVGNTVEDVTIDLRRGNPIPPGGMAVVSRPRSGEAGVSLTLLGDGATPLAYSPEAVVSGRGALRLGSQPIDLTGVGVVVASGFGSLTFAAPATAASINVIEAEPGQSCIFSDTPDRALSPLLLQNVGELMLDLSAAGSETPMEVTVASASLPTLRMNSGAADVSLSVASGAVDLGESTGSSLRVNVGSAASVSVLSKQSLAGLSLEDAARLVVRPSGGNLLQTGALTLAPHAVLDLGDNDLAVAATAENRNALLAALTEQIRSARGVAGTWDGAGITSSAAAADRSRATGLAAILNDNGTGKPIVAILDGQPLDANAVLVRYTWNGDTDLNGRIDADDYFQVDQGYLRQKQGYRDGDLNYSGSVDADDYRMIDGAFHWLATEPGAASLPARAKPVFSTSSIRASKADLRSAAAARKTAKAKAGPRKARVVPHSKIPAASRFTWRPSR